MPETWAQAAVVLTLVVPGLVYRASWQAGRVHAPGGIVIACADAIAVDFSPRARDTRPGAEDDREDGG